MGSQVFNAKHNDIIKAAKIILDGNEDMGNLSKKGQFNDVYEKMTSDLNNVLKDALYNHVSGSFEYLCNKYVKSRYDVLNSYYEHLLKVTSPRYEQLESYHVSQAKKFK